MPKTEISYIVRRTSGGCNVVRREKIGDDITETAIADYQDSADAWQTRAVLCLEIGRVVAAISCVFPALDISGMVRTNRE